MEHGHRLMLQHIEKTEHGGRAFPPAIEIKHGPAHRTTGHRQPAMKPRPLHLKGKRTNLVMPDPGQKRRLGTTVEQQLMEVCHRPGMLTGQQVRMIEGLCRDSTQNGQPPIWNADFQFLFQLTNFGLKYLYVESRFKLNHKSWLRY